MRNNVRLSDTLVFKFDSDRREYTVYDSYSSEPIGYIEGSLNDALYGFDDYVISYDVFDFAKNNGYHNLEIDVDNGAQIYDVAGESEPEDFPTLDRPRFSGARCGDLVATLDEDGYLFRLSDDKSDEIAYNEFFDEIIDFAKYYEYEKVIFKL